MKVILRADISSLGRLGDVVTVKPGFGRNYLLPKGLAMPATKGNIKQFEMERRKLQKQMDAYRHEAQEIADKMSSVEINIPVRVGEEDKLYGSVTTSNIADALLEEHGIEVDKRKILLEEPIRELGDFTIPVRLHPDVNADLKVSVVKHEQEQGSKE